MKHLMTILEIKHWHCGKCVWEDKNIKNTLHSEGEEYILSCMFRSNAGFSVPSFYYLGLDNRSTIEIDDTMSAVTPSEPTTHGYSRQPMSSASGFVVEQVDDVWIATSNLVAFSASGGSWGPVNNLFLSDQIGSSGLLISSASLGGARTVVDGDTITMKLAMSLGN